MSFLWLSLSYSLLSLATASTTSPSRSQGRSQRPPLSCIHRLLLMQSIILLFHQPPASDTRNFCVMSLPLEVDEGRIQRGTWFNKVAASSRHSGNLKKPSKLCFTLLTVQYVTRNTLVEVSWVGRTQHLWVCYTLLHYEDVWVAVKFLLPRGWELISVIWCTVKK